jgi:dTMP kinase
MSGLFITFEGGEGAGKSTQLRILSEKLAPCLVTREPGGTKRAEILRQFILSGKAKSWGAEAEAVLFAAARLDHVETRIAPALSKGEHVICDRFYDSTAIYQGFLGGLDAQFLNNLARAACGQTHPHLTFILDVPVEIGFARVKERGEKIDRFEGETRAFHEKLRLGFQQLAHQYPNRCYIIDGSHSTQIIAEEIFTHVQAKLT